MNQETKRLFVESAECRLWPWRRFTSTPVFDTDSVSAFFNVLRRTIQGFPSELLPCEKMQSVVVHLMVVYFQYCCYLQEDLLDNRLLAALRRVVLLNLDVAIFLSDRRQVKIRRWLRVGVSINQMVTRERRPMNTFLRSHLQSRDSEAKVFRTLAMATDGRAYIHLKC